MRTLRDQRQTHVHRRPRTHVLSNLDRPPVSGQQHRAAALLRKVHTQRRRRPDCLVEALLARGGGGIHDDQRSGIELGHETALQHLASPSHRRPVDA